MKVFDYPADRREALFTESFLTRVPIENINNIISTYKSTLGELETIENSNGQYDLKFEKGSASSYISFDAEGKISGFWLGSWLLEKDSLEKIVSELKGLDSSISLCISKDDHPLFSLNGEEEMAVGSSFKLYVLKALYDKLERKTWKKILWLKSDDISLPTGLLHKWPVGTPVTVKALANLMMAYSDNTATDMLINLIGKKYLEKETSPKNRPFLTTAEAFNLKYGVSSARQQDYITGDTRRKRKILEDFRSLRASANHLLASTPKLIDEIEWFFSTAELASLIYELREAEELYKNPGLASGADWYRAGYKGGSETGVLQYTHLLQKSKNSPIYTFSLTANNPEKGLSGYKITEIASRLISLIKFGRI